MKFPFFSFAGVPSCERVSFQWISSLEPKLRRQPPQSSSKGNLLVRVRFGGRRGRFSSTVEDRGCPEYGSVAYFVERSTRETQAEQYSRSPAQGSRGFGAP